LRKPAETRFAKHNPAVTGIPAARVCRMQLTCAALCNTIQYMAPLPRIGTKIRRARERRRWTQQQLAEALVVSRNTVDAWENDRAYPKSSIGAIEEVLGISLTDDGQADIISPRLRKIIEEELSAEDGSRVIGLLEGTLAWPDEPEAPAEPGEDEAEGESGG
jgi:transcriptional regulator with XRE-family HTH domain